ncbi:S8 family peptidase [Haliangium sp.]|uniref:S8 family peptidase n=1 Tax=Haliangium sp. TaxID=2663208 RepID=UPI003D0F56AD
MSRTRQSWPQVAPPLPWRPDLSRMAMRGRAVVQMRPGWTPERIASHAGVLRGMAQANSTIDRGRLDQAIRRFSPRMRVTRAFEARVTAGTARAHTGWDELEESLGLSRVLRVEVDPDASVIALVDALRQLDVVESASPHYLCQTPFADRRVGDDLPPSWGHELIGAAAALRQEPGDPTVIVAVVDSGVALAHPEFRGRLRPGVDTVDLPPVQLSRAVSLEGDTTTLDLDANDEVGHGSACAGVIGARGLFAAPGVAGASPLQPVRTLARARIAGRAEATALGAICDIDVGLKRAVDLGARVLNLSFGTPASALSPGDPLPHAGVVDYAVARGCLLVAAAGNAPGRTVYYPAAHPGVIAVGAIEPSGRPAEFSTRGDHVALCAPGVSIYAPSIDGYGSVTGTSFAAPFVAGACALLLARGYRRSTPVTTALAREVLRASARPFPAGVDHDGCGAGILDIPAALAQLDHHLSQAETFGSTISREPVTITACHAGGSPLARP